MEQKFEMGGPKVESNLLCAYIYTDLWMCFRDSAVKLELSCGPLMWVYC